MSEKGKKKDDRKNQGKFIFTRKNLCIEINSRAALNIQSCTTVGCERLGTLCETQLHDHLPH